jgi:hypothetical protein
MAYGVWFQLYAISYQPYASQLGAALLHVEKHRYAR